MLASTAVAGAGLAAAAAAGCGDDDDDAPSAGITAVAGTTEAAGKQGGTFRTTGGAVGSLDPNSATSGTDRVPLQGVYSRLFMLASGPGVPGITSKAVPDAAQSFETPDGLVYTIKLRPNVKFHPPISRIATAEDVVITFERYMGRAPGYQPAFESARLNIVNSLRAVDPATLRFELKEPYGLLPSLLQPAYSLSIMPREAGTAFDPTKQMVGSGPWMFEDLSANTRIRFRRNPEWHFSPKPYLDGLDMYITQTEYATRLTQFMAGGFDEMMSLESQDVKRVKDSIPNAQIGMRRGSGTPLSVIAFSALEPNAPWQDARVRQAMSMAFDRDAMTEAVYNLRDLERLGIKFDRVWNNFIAASYEDHWLDPRGSAINPNVAKLFKYDPAEAKRLMAQAGYADGFNVRLHHIAALGGSSLTMYELTAQYLGQIGIRTTLVADDLAATYRPKTRGGDFDGLAFIQVGGVIDPLDYYLQMYIKGSSRNSSRVDDPTLQARILTIQRKLNEEDRRKDIIDLQNTYLPEKMYYIPMQLGAGPGFEAFQPYVRNALEYFSIDGSPGLGKNTEQRAHYWLDK